MASGGTNVFLGKRVIWNQEENPPQDGTVAQVGSRAMMQNTSIVDNTTHGEELASLNFSKLIGGPLVACVKAQAQASMMSVTFLKEFGFTKGQDGEMADPVYVEFNYDKPGLFGMPTKTRLRVPLICLLHVPFLRIEYCEIEFLAKITSTVSQSVDRIDASTQMNTSNNSNSGTSEKESSNKDNWWWNQWSEKRKSRDEWASSSSMMATTATQVNTKEGATVTKEFSIKVKVRAVSDQMPAGMEKVLNILEGQMSEDNGNKLLQKVMEGAVAGIGGGVPAGTTGGAGSTGTPTPGTGGTNNN